MKKQVTISYAVTACNEHEELDRLLNQLANYAGLEDEVIIQVDSENVTQEVLDILEKYTTEFQEVGYSFIKYPLNKNFSDFKNNLKSYCKKDYIFFIDADEYLSHALLVHLRDVLATNKILECIHVPRVNTVEGITQEHVSQWKWQLDKKGRINWPDYQTRIMKNQESMKWQGKVHERICGCMIYTYLPDEDETWAIYHAKNIDRQEKQNKLYDTI